MRVCLKKLIQPLQLSDKQVSDVNNCKKQIAGLFFRAIYIIRICTLIICCKLFAMQV